MDPIAALEIINDPEQYDSHRCEALDGLCEWVAKGGAFPDDKAGEGRLTDEAVEWANSDPSIELNIPDMAASLQAALVNGDLSGLKFLCCRSDD